MKHVHQYELLLKDLYIAVFFCECGVSRTAPVDGKGRIHFWSTSAKEPRLLEVINDQTRGCPNGD